MTEVGAARQFGTRHKGELTVRGRLGVPGALDPRLPTVRPALDPNVAYFLMEQQTLVISAIGPDGRIWITSWAGPKGFVSPAARNVLVVDNAWTSPGDPVVPLLTEGTSVGLTSVDFATRARVRVNGTVLDGGDGRLAVLTDQVYGNCPKYIQQRTHELEPRLATGAEQPSIGSSLTEEQIAVLRRADSFFMGTGVPGTGADASHRGGMPGFIAVPSPGMLRWPDYPGNRMFMTLGNLELHGYAGIVVPVWDDGTLLHLSGRARVLWGPPGNPADRHVELALEKVVERRAALPLRWTFHGYSPANPPVEPEPPRN